MSARPARPPVRHAAAVLALVATFGVLASAAGACSADPSTTGESTVSFETELREAEQMIAEASALVGDPAPPVHENSSGGNLAGAPDPSRQRRDITVTWTQDEPPPFAAIRDLWTGSFGFAVTSQDANAVFLSKGDLRASVNQGLPAADGARNVWFGVSTGLHPAAEVPEPG
jgi:hypothetical protein